MNTDVLTTVITRMREHFGRDIVSRREILDWQIGGGHYIPTNFWKTRNVTRGMYSIAENFSPYAAYQQMAPAPVQQPVVQTQEVVAPVQQQSYVVSHFDRESLIPSVNENYIEWGNYKMVEKMVASNRFFTLYLTGDSGSGKNEMIAHACAKLRRPMVRVSITADTKEDHLIGSKTLVDGNIKYEEGPLIWAAEAGAVLLLDELSCLREDEEVRIGTVENWVSIKLSNLEYGKEYPIVSFNMETNEFENDIGYVIKEGIKEIYEVELEDGRKIFVTDDHPFICMDEDTAFEKTISDGFGVGDSVVVME